MFGVVIATILHDLFEDYKKATLIDPSCDKAALLQAFASIIRQDIPEALGIPPNAVGAYGEFLVRLIEGVTKPEEKERAGRMESLLHTVDSASSPLGRLILLIKAADRLQNGHTLGQDPAEMDPEELGADDLKVIRIQRETLDVLLPLFRNMGNAIVVANIRGGFASPSQDGIPFYRVCCDGKLDQFADEVQVDVGHLFATSGYMKCAEPIVFPVVGSLTFPKEGSDGVLRTSDFDFLVAGVREEDAIEISRALQVIRLDTERECYLPKEVPGKVLGHFSRAGLEQPWRVLVSAHASRDAAIEALLGPCLARMQGVSTPFSRDLGDEERTQLVSEAQLIDGAFGHDRRIDARMTAAFSTWRNWRCYCNKIFFKLSKDKSLIEEILGFRVNSRSYFS